MNNCKLITTHSALSIGSLIRMTCSALEDQYTFGVRTTDHQPAIAIRMRLTPGALNEGRSRKARAANPSLPYGERVPLLQCCISKLADAVVKPWGALRACGYSAVGAIESEISGTGLQGQVRYGGVDQDSRVPKAYSSSHSTSIAHGVTSTGMRARGHIADCQTNRYITLREIMARPVSSERTPSGQDSGLPNGQPGHRRVIAARGT